jgi:DNA replication and repair protein RecF
MFSKDASSIRANLTKQGVSHLVEIDLKKNQKKVHLDSKKIGYTSDYIKNFFSILFSPDQLVFFKEYPLERRNFIDRVLVLVDRNYFQLVKDFNRIKKQKGFLLRQGNAKDVAVWNHMLSRVISKMTHARDCFVGKINDVLTDIFSHLTGREDKLEFHYQGDLDKRAERDESSILSFLQKKLSIEIEKGHLCFGPHKDQFWLTLDGRRDKQSFSQGEHRITFLALQFSINLLIQEIIGFNPVILLDDIFSELDTGVYNKTIDYIDKRENQVFITSTEIPSLLMEKGSSYKISKGFLETGSRES